MTTGFDSGNPPFDRLSHGELEELRQSLDIAYFKPGEVIVARGSGAEFLHVVIKGAVEGREGEALQAVLGAKDSFDARALVHGAAGEDFIAAEETLCFLVPKAVVLRLIARNAGFAAFFYAEVSRKLEALTRGSLAGTGVETVLRGRVREARFAPAVFIDGGETIEAAGQRMAANNVNSLFVRDAGRIGVVTGMNLSKAVVLRRMPLSTLVRDECRFDLVAVGADDFVYDALLQMTRHNKRRLAVRGEDGEFAGFLEDIDILGLFAGNSQLIPGRIDRATRLDDLGEAARDIGAQVERLHKQGIRVEVIAEITSDLNRRFYGRLFDMLAPPAIREGGCLLLMGSEGRGEQTVRTDQDNGLLLDAGVPETEVRAFGEAFSGALERFGFPPCPGNVMLRNPLWSQPVDDFSAQLRRWAHEWTPEAAMNIAIFYDAVSVAGRSDLLPRARGVLLELLRGEPALLARFAGLAETFATPSLGLFGSLMASVGVGDDTVELKKAGSFPIVHGVRALAIAQQVAGESTTARIAGLVQANALEPGFGDELTGALRVFMEYRLRAQLDAARRGTPEQEAVLRAALMSPSDRDILRDALRIVRQFRAVLRARFNLGAF